MQQSNAPVAQHGCTPLITELYEQNRPLLTRFLRARAVARDDLPDLLQEVYLRFSRQADRVGPEAVDPARATGLLLTIARNLVIDRVRHRKVSETDPDVDVEALLDPLPAPEQQVIRQEALDQLSAVIEQLPPQCRRVFVMRKIHQMSQKAIAEKLGLSVSTVEKHVAAGMKQCRRLLVHD